ncbi:MAG: Xaa-Pro peptidase family protein [Anaerolineae bacterium]|nr:Xaa-Pro peptidase family protein [Anaerolineae bacterium]MDQ7036540.1 Xaa-Pro peptidase family protein [Anaerolineae bacterium]
MDYSNRINQFQELLGAVADIAFFPVSADLEYLTGVPRDTPSFGATMHPGAWLEGAWFNPKHEPILALPRMTAEFGGLERLSGIQMRILGDWDDTASMVQGFLDSFGISGKVHVAIGDKTEGETTSHLHQLLPEATFVSATDILRKMRVIKSDEEIAVMKKAGEITEAAFADVCTKLKHGMTELDIVTEVDYQLRRHGSLGPSFTTSLYNSGPNHPLLFGQREATWSRVLTPPVSILFDFGAIYNGFCYDYGRTVFFGEPDAEFLRIYKLIMDSQAAGIAAMRAGKVTTEEVDAAARQVIIDGGKAEEFRHRLGHGIGMDVHEPPFLTQGNKTVIQEGMLFTVEPSITQFDTFSARVEDVVVVRPQGGEPLTSGFQELQIID